MNRTICTTPVNACACRVINITKDGSTTIYILHYLQVTTHSHLLSQDELDHISSKLLLDPSHVHAFSLQEFDTELDFSNKVRYVCCDCQTTN